MKQQQRLDFVDLHINDHYITGLAFCIRAKSGIVDKHGQHNFVGFGLGMFAAFHFVVALLGKLTKRMPTHAFQA